MKRPLSDSEDVDLSESVDAADSESSSSSGSSATSSSSYSTTEDGYEDGGYDWTLGALDSPEMANIEGELLQLPRGLCEDENIFNNFFSMDTWNYIPEELQTQLYKYLPKFNQVLLPEESKIELQQTIRMLFDKKMDRFGFNDLEELQKNLEKGNYRPDVLPLRKSIAKSRRREQRFKNYDRLSKFAKQLFISRERLLQNIIKSDSDTAIIPKKSIRRKQSLLHDHTKLYTIRARKRFCNEVEEIAQQLNLPKGFCSDMENDDIEELSFCETADGLDSNKQSPTKVDDSIKNATSTTTSEKYVYGTFFNRKRSTLDEDALIIQQRKQRPKLTSLNIRFYLAEHKRRKLTEPNLPDFETSDIRLRDVCTRAQMANSFKRLSMANKSTGRKSKSKAIEPPALVPIQNLTQKVTGDTRVVNISNIVDWKNAQVASNNKQDNSNIGLRDGNETVFHMIDGDVDLQQEEVIAYSGSCDETVPSFVTSNQIMPSIPLESRNSELTQNILKYVDTDIEVVSSDKNKHNTYNNLSLEEKSALIKSNKDMFAVTSKNVSSVLNRAVTQSLNALNVNNPIVIGNKKRSFTYPSNTELIEETHACFFSLIRDFFCATPNHRMKYSDLKGKIDVWLCNPITALNDWYSQTDNWSSLLVSGVNFLAGEFSDLPDEYVPYIEHKAQLSIYQWIGAGRDSDGRLTTLCNYWMQRRNEFLESTIENKLEKLSSTINRRNSPEIEDIGIYDNAHVPPAPLPRFPTSWTVRAATLDEIIDFQRQERERFENPHKAYTYRMYGYESIVGPVKGIYSQTLALTKARGHSMMVGDRPNFVTILTLVRDATARLPNGEGTRADISELLKCSQYINREAAENVLQTIVSGALDRMHTEHDPCVRYDPKRKIWIYLHRNRSEDEFEKMHQQNQGVGKHKKPTNRKQKSKLAKDNVDLDAVTTGILTDGNIIGLNQAFISNASNNVSLPALVPTTGHHIPNATITVGKVHQNQTLSKYPPVPPLKYNIPQSSGIQQKSLLKSTLHSQRHSDEKSSEINSSLAVRVTDLKHIQSQRNQLRNLANSPIAANVTTAGKQFTFSIPQVKSTVATSPSNTGRTTPIIVATPTGLQTVHIANSANNVQTPNTTLSATVGGKKVALNKPIIINQISQQTQSKSKTSPLNKLTNQQLLKQQQNFVIPGGNIVSNTIIDGRKLTSTTSPSHITIDNNQVIVKDPTNRNIQTIFMDNSQIITTDIAGTMTQVQSQTQSQPTSQAKNIIRLVPAINSGNVKSLMPTQGVTTIQSPSLKQPVQLVGQRIVTNSPVRPMLQQKSTLSNNVTVIGAGGGTISTSNVVKMTPQAFASLQQSAKQGHQIIVKQAGSISPSIQPQQSRVVMSNTIIPQSPQGAANKNIVVQQLPFTALTQKSVSGNPGIKTIGTVSSVASQTSGVNKIQTINTTSLTPQQQRVLLQNLKQQQQQPQNQPQMQLKTVQVLQPSGEPQSQNLKPNQTLIQQGVRNKTLTIVSPQRTVPTSIVSSQSPNTGKTVTVSVSPQQRIIKTVNPIQSQQQTLSIDAAQINTSPATSGTRISTSLTGQIISLESLLQKQGGALKITSGAGVNTLKQVQTTSTANFIQLATSNATVVSQGQPQNTQYAVVSQGKNIISLGVPQRILTTQAGGSSGTTLMNTSQINVTTGKEMVTSKLPGAVGRIVTTGAVGSPNPRLIGKTTMISPSGATGTTTSTQPSSIRVIGSTVGKTTAFNLANLQGNKQVVFTTNKATTLGGKTVTNLTTSGTNQTQQLQNASIIIGGQTVKLQNNSNIVQQLNKTGNIISSPQQAIIMGNQILKLQQMPSTVVKTGTPIKVATSIATGDMMKSDDTNEAIINTTSATLLPKTLVLGSGNQSVRVQSIGTHQTQLATTKNLAATSGIQQKTSPNRVVLAVQGGSQIYLSPNFSGGSLNLKSLQNMKVVSLAHTTNAKDANKQQNTLSGTSNQPHTLVKSIGTGSMG